jgi:hypothetical protein
MSRPCGKYQDRKLGETFYVVVAATLVMILPVILVRQSGRFTVNFKPDVVPTKVKKHAQNGRRPQKPGIRHRAIKVG